MDKEIIKDKLYDYLENMLSCLKEAIKPEARLNEDLDIDSCNKVELVIWIEGEFGIAILDSEASDIMTVNDMLDHIAKRVL